MCLGMLHISLVIHVYDGCHWTTGRGELKVNSEKVYFMSQILEQPSIGEYWNISGVPVLPENVMFRFFKTCWCYSEDYNTGT